jgi:hypothetical protein
MLLALWRSDCERLGKDQCEMRRARLLPTEMMLVSLYQGGPTGGWCLRLD